MSLTTDAEKLRAGLATALARDLRQLGLPAAPEFVESQQARIVQLTQELSLAEEGLANYQQEVNGLLVENSNLRGVRDQLLKDDGDIIERLRTALQKYGFHTSECSAGFPISDHCTCGFSDALASRSTTAG